MEPQTQQVDPLTNTKRFFMANEAVDKPPYECPTCGFVLPYKRTFLSYANRYLYERDYCPCETEQIRIDDERRLEQARQKELPNAKRLARLEGRLARMTFDSFLPSAKTQDAFEQCKRFVAVFPKETGLILQGPVGCGKTHLACAVVNAIIEADPWRTRVRFYESFALLETIRHSYEDEAMADDIETLSRLDLLVIDDLGNERIAAGERGDWAREQFFAIINERWKHERPTIVTTNYDALGFRDRIGEAFLSRLLDLCGKPVVIQADDYRLKTAKGRLPNTQC